jgi:hypothetical protein
MLVRCYSRYSIHKTLITLLWSSRDGEHFKLQKMKLDDKTVYPCQSNYTFSTPLGFRYTVPLRPCFPEWRGSSLLHAPGDCAGFPVLQYSQEQDLINTLQRQNTEISKQIFLEKELRGHSPNFHIHVSVSDLYITTIDLTILLQENMWTDPGNI